MEQLTAPPKPQNPSPLLGLPIELRHEILRYLLCMDCNREAHTRRPPQCSISELLYLNPRRILEAAPFKHKGNQEINGNPPIITRCELYPAVLKTCKQLYGEGRTVLYSDNKVLAIQSGIKGLGAKFSNYGIPVLGPFPSSRLINGTHDGSQPYEFRFNPLMLFTGGATKRDAPFYICSHMDAVDFLHALWIMVKSPFARGMGFHLSLSTELHPRHLNLTDSFVKLAILPWLHTNINSITFHRPRPDPLCNEKPSVISDAYNARLISIRDEFTKHLLASRKETNLHLYKTICDYLERILLQGEIYVESGNFIRGELSFERVNYEACSLVRTRTSALVDVSSRTKDGINRVCKLIAVSAYRLCELRSGSLAQLVLKKQENLQAKEKSYAEPKSYVGSQTCNVTKEEDSDSPEESALAASEDSSSVDSSSELRNSLNETATTKIGVEKPAEIRAGKPQAAPFISKQSKSTLLPRTTRLEPQLARDLALTSGLLALRLPCASPVPEWNIRLDIMLLRLFTKRGDISNAVWCIRRIHNNAAVVLNGVKQKNKAGEKKWEPFRTCMQDLAQQLKPGAPRQCFFEIAEKVEEVVALLWGERLIPKKGFNGLIWTFRWAG